MELIENRTFDEIKIGDSATLERTLTEQDITLFAAMSGDINPAHVDPEYATSSRFREVIGHRHVEWRAHLHSSWNLLSRAWHNLPGPEFALPSARESGRHY
jgi:MaoC like domain